MFWCFVIIAIFVAVMMGTLVFQQEKWNERWIDLAAGSFIGNVIDEEEGRKLPAGIYKLSWTPIERS